MYFPATVANKNIDIVFLPHVFNFEELSKEFIFEHMFRNLCLERDRAEIQALQEPGYCR